MSQKITYFLVDDDIEDHEIFSIALNDMNKTIECITALDGEEAIQKLNENESFIPDVIFIDLNMPRMNGKQCLIEIKKIPRLMHIPVVMFTTSDKFLDMEETKELGADYFITKPPSISMLSEALMKLFP